MRAPSHEVGVDRPLLGGQAAAEVAGDGGEGDVDDGAVEESDERPQDGDHEDESLLGVICRVIARALPCPHARAPGDIVKGWAGPPSLQPVRGIPRSVVS
jgi:hypothetical protein